MEMMARVRAWCARESTRTLLWDTLLAAVLIAGCVPFNGVTNPDSTGGILFPATQASMTLWSLPVFVPLMLRRYCPEPAAWLFVALTITHLVFGPAITYFDFYALIMVYSVILYGSPRHSWRFIVTAFVMGLITATVWSVSFNVGPLFAEPSSGSRTIRDGWLADAITMPTCPAVTGVVGASAAVNCGAKMLADVGMEAALIESSVLSIIIMALWQRARKATLTAMRERNASIVAREAEETHIAALAERARIARDMHDVVAHTLSTIIVQSDVAADMRARMILPSPGIR